MVWFNSQAAIPSIVWEEMVPIVSTGAGNVVVPSDGRIAKILHTWAAHNEYLRINVEGARSVGITAHQFRDAARLLAAIEDFAASR